MIAAVILMYYYCLRFVLNVGDLWEVTIQDVEEDSKGNMKFTEKCTRYRAKFVAVATGHHAKPIWPNFPGQDTFKGDKSFFFFTLKLCYNA